MFKKKYQIKKRLVSILLVPLFCITLVAPAFAADVELTAEQKAALEEAAESYKSSKAEINTTKNTIAELNVELQTIQSTIDTLDVQMADTKAELARLEVQKAAQEAELEERMRVMYMYGDDGYWELLFSAEDFAELLTRIDQVRAVMQSDRDCVNAIQATEKQIESGIADLEESKANVEILKTRQETLIASNQALLLTQQLQYEAEKSAADALAQSLGYYGIEAYINELDWPLDTNNPNAFHISDWFGARSWDATGGVGSTDHQGIDITPGAGEPILAAASGVVAKAEYNYSYGNVVVIEHGKNNSGETIHTLYAHQESYIVSVGESVTQGQVIGYVGSTGQSTGAHLHFEVWVNSVPVDPMTYLERYRDRCTFTG